MPPASGSVLGWTNGFYDISKGNLPVVEGVDVFSKGVSVNKTKISVFDLNGAVGPTAAALKMTVTVAPTTGLVTGEFKHPANNAITKIYGIVVQHPYGTFAQGYFLGTTKIGGIRLYTIPQEQ